MLDRPEPDLGEIEHLPCLMADGDRVTQTLPAAAACRRDMIDDIVRRCDLSQMAALVTRLAAGLAPRRTPQALGRRLGQSVRRRRPRRVTRVLRKAPRQLGRLGLELNDALLKPLNGRGLLDHKRSELLIRRARERHITTFEDTRIRPAPPEQSP